MTKEEIISGLKFTVEMFLLDPSTGETITEPRNDMDKTTIDACRGAIELLEQEPKTGHFYPPCEDCNKKMDEIRKAYDKLQDRPTGHWFIDERPESDREVVCSNCDQPIFKYHKLDFDYRPKYCPNCGAKMIER